MALPTRRPQGTLSAAVPVYAQVAPEARDTFDRIHRATGAPKWVVMEQILAHVDDELDEHGVPAWWPEQPTQQEELPLKTA